MRGSKFRREPGSWSIAASGSRRSKRTVGSGFGSRGWLAGAMAVFIFFSSTRATISTGEPGETWRDSSITPAPRTAAPKKLPGKFGSWRDAIFPRARSCHSITATDSRSGGSIRAAAARRVAWALSSTPASAGYCAGRGERSGWRRVRVRKREARYDQTVGGVPPPLWTLMAGEGTRPTLIGSGRKGLFSRIPHAAEPVVALEFFHQ